MNLFREPANAAPMAWFTGVKDNSGRSPQLTEVTRAIHTPIHFGYASMGPTTPQLVAGANLVSMYGNELIESRSKFATPSLPFIRRLQANANPFMFQRLVPSDLPGDSQREKEEKATARIALCLEIEEVTNLPQYKRRAAGANDDPQTFVGDLILGNKNLEVREEDTSKPLIPKGFRAQWVYTKVEKLGEAVKTPKGNIVRYPIVEFQASWFGSYGNNLGVSIYAPTTFERSPVNEALMRDQLAYMYRLEFVKRDNEFSTPVIIPNNYGDEYTTFSFKEGAFNRQLGNQDLFIDTMLLDQYRNLDPVAGRDPVYGPFNEIHVYHENIEEILKMVYTEEVKHNPKFAAFAMNKPAEEAAHLINFVSGYDQDGVEYVTYVVKSDVKAFDTATGTASVQMSRSTRIFGMGGADGTMNYESFDRDVRRVFQNMGTSFEQYKVEDMAQYPFRCIYDVGYSMETKDAIFRILSIRPDVNVTMSPHDVVTKKTRAELYEQRKFSGMLPRLKSLLLKAENYPESTIYGTSVMRAVFPTDIGVLMNSDWTQEVPATIEIQEMRSAYMGSPEGVLRAGKGYDESPNNVLKLLKNVNTTAVFGSLREQMWAAGGVWFQNKRRNTPFCPAVQTAYKDDTSVLNSDINMQILCEISYICFEVWTELTGSTRYTDEQFIARSDKLIADRCRDVFDGRVIITPRTSFTKQDKDRAWSWSCYVDVELSNMRTVARNTLIAHRIGERS